MAEADYRLVRDVWNNLNDEEYRQDQSHWRGVGRWTDDAAWQGIGTNTRQRIDEIRKFTGRPPIAAEEALSVLEWGPGGGANAFAFRNIAYAYHGVDISEKNLREAARMLSAEDGSMSFAAHLLDPTGAPRVNLPDAHVDVVISTSVFQHFPSQDYGIAVLKELARVAKPDAIGAIQIRFDNGNPKWKPIEDLGQYTERFITANAYALDSFWDALFASGWVALYISHIATRNNYARFAIRRAS